MPKPKKSVKKTKKAKIEPEAVTSADTFVGEIVPGPGQKGRWSKRGWRKIG